VKPHEAQVRVGSQDIAGVRQIPPSESAAAECLTPEQVRQYEDVGYLFLSACFSEAEARVMKLECKRLMAEGNDGRQSGLDVLWAPHTESAIFDELVRHPRLLGPSIQLVGSDVYVFRSKLHTKIGFASEMVPWHQDYKRWHDTDGLPSPRITSIAVFLDEISEFNGGLTLIPASHKEGLLLPLERSDVFGAAFEKRRFDVDLETVGRLIEKYGLVQPRGPAGSVLIFAANLVHASGPNMTPWPRDMALLAHNSVENALLPRSDPRPEYKASRTVSPLTSVSDDALSRRASSLTSEHV